MARDSDYGEMCRNLPMGLERALLGVLKFHIGRNRAIARTDLIDDLGSMGFQVTDRVMRAQINSMRKDGILICSAGGDSGGYWLAASREEVEEFIERELEPRAMDLLEQAKAIRKAMEERWGEGKQLGLL